MTYSPNFLVTLFSRNEQRFAGIRPFNIYLMRAVYFLMAFVMGADVWSHIFSHEEEWQPSDAMDWSVWAAFSVFAIIGLFRTVEMIPILLLEIVYKGIWIVLVAVPLWRINDLNVDSADGMVLPFILVILPIVAVPWGYVLRTYIWSPKSRV